MTSGATVRAATVADIPHLAHQRVAMFRDMGTITPKGERPLSDATADYLRRALPAGEYLAWVAEDTSGKVIGGAGVLLRTLVPRPRADQTSVNLGPEAIVLSVYVEAANRRKGVAEQLMGALLDEIKRRKIHRLVLHASDDGRRIYERLGFKQTNEMKLDVAVE